MCEYFSFLVDDQGQCYALLGQEREKIIEKGGNPDSHSEIASYYGIDEDKCWKFDLQLSFDEWKRLLQGEALTTIKVLKDCYDGGRALEEMTIPITQKVQQWLADNEKAIMEAGKLKFENERLKELVFGGDEWNKSFIVALNRARTLEEIVNKLELKEAQRGWGNYIYRDPEGNLIRVIMRDPSGLGNVTHLAVQRWTHRYARINKETDQVEVFEERRVNIIPSSIPIKE